MTYYAVWNSLYAFVSQILHYFGHKIRLSFVLCTLRLYLFYFFVSEDIPWMYRTIRLSNNDMNPMFIFVLRLFRKTFTLIYGNSTAISFEVDTLDKARCTSLIELGIRLRYCKAYSISIISNGFVNDFLLFIQKKVRLLCCYKRYSCLSWFIRLDRYSCTLCWTINTTLIIAVLLCIVNTVRLFW